MADRIRIEGRRRTNGGWRIHGQRRGCRRRRTERCRWIWTVDGGAGDPGAAKVVGGAALYGFGATVYGLVACTGCAGVGN